MSLIPRKPRPLVRERAELKQPASLFIVACDDTYAPKQYFDAFEIVPVQIHVVPTTDGSSHAKHVLSRLLEFEFEDGDERWMLLDTDHCIRPGHLPTFLATIEEAKSASIKIAVSRPCFELWLALHHVDPEYLQHLNTAAEVEAALKNILGQYNKRKLKPSDFPIDSVAQACDRAHRMDVPAGGPDIPDTTSTRVYQLWKAIAAKVPASQLPPELQALRES